MRMWRHEVSPEEAGSSVETILRRAGFTKKEISRQKFRKDGILLDGIQCRSTERVRAAQVLCLTLSAVSEEDREETKQEPHPEARGTEAAQKRDKTGSEEKNRKTPGRQAAGICGREPELCYEDDCLAVLAKPSGMPCHIGRGHFGDDLGSWAAAHLDLGAEPLRLIGRLDRDTSGLVLLAKDRLTAARLWRQRQEGILRKVYTVLVHGSPEEKSGTISLPISGAEGEKNRMVTGSGKPAVTHFRVEEALTLDGGSVSRLSCTLETGRTHQIRVHLASLGHPVLGDPIYGIPDGVGRLCLHAGEMMFRHPCSGERMHLVLEFLLPETVRSERSAACLLSDQSSG